MEGYGLRLNKRIGEPEGTVEGFGRWFERT